MALRILHLSQYRTVGGAAKMAWALHGALRGKGVDSLFLCQEAGGPADAGCVAPSGSSLVDRARQRLDRVPLLASPRRTREPFSPALVPGGLLGEIRRLAPDLVHLHWLGGGFVSVGEVARLPGPLVWTLHDLWPFTGGCHYPGACLGFGARCGACPVLGSSRRTDLATLGQRWKRAYARRVDLHPVGISRWMVGMAERSVLFGERVVAWIPNGVDRGVFSPGDRGAARARLGWPADARILVFGAVSPLVDRRKGGELLFEALERLARDPGPVPIRCMVFGAAGQTPPALGCGPRPTPGGVPRPAPEGVPLELLGPIDDPERLALLYRAADVVVAPSLQEGYGLVSAEAVACGTPVVAFAGTGAEDFVEHGVTGHLAERLDAEALVQGIRWALGLRGAPRAEGKPGARAPLDLPEVAARYLGLYERVLERAPPAGSHTCGASISAHEE